jgi:hypothetical protein
MNGEKVVAAKQRGEPSLPGVGEPSDFVAGWPIPWRVDPYQTAIGINSRSIMRSLCEAVSI